jgi:hypothetical protein
MSSDQQSEDVKRYISLVDFLIGQQALGSITAEEVAGLLAVDSGLYHKYLTSTRDGPIETTPLRAAHAVAEIQIRLTKRHPELAPEASRLVGSPNSSVDGVMRYFELVVFLEKKVRADLLTREDYQSLMAIDPKLHREYLDMTTHGATIDIGNARANVTAAAIENQMAIRHPDLAREFDLSTAKQSR